MATNNAVNAKTAGIQSLTTGGAYNGRTITGTANQISVSNGDGTAGNPTLSLTSTIQVSGISFDAGSNTLSAFSEGTFSPTITNSGTAATVTYASPGQIGFYLKLGDGVNFTARNILTAYTAGTGNVQQSALPFTSNTTGSRFQAFSCRMQQVTFGVSVLWYTPALGPNTTDITFQGNRSAASQLPLAAAGPSATTDIVTTGWYST